MRIYLIANNRRVRLVRANTKMQALKHVAVQELTIRIATQDDLVKYVEQTQVETAVPPDQGKLDLI
jgi:hypothetical protein